MIDRKDTWSGIPGVRMTNQPHREWIYRMAFEAGRHIIGYEVQKVLAAVDWFATRAVRSRSQGGAKAASSRSTRPRSIHGSRRRWSAATSSRVTKSGRADLPRRLGAAPRLRGRRGGEPDRAARADRRGCRLPGSDRSAARNARPPRRRTGRHTHAPSLAEVRADAERAGRAACGVVTAMVRERCFRCSASDLRPPQRGLRVAGAGSISRSGFTGSSTTGRPHAGRDPPLAEERAAFWSHADASSPERWSKTSRRCATTSGTK